MPLSAGARIGPYEILSPLGAGGMGEVYRARDTRLRREVAIKVLPRELVNDPERRSRFEREAQAVSALNNPHIITLYEAGTCETGPYLVLEKIEGESLRDILRDGLLPLRRFIGLAAQIADGLAKAHATGVVHRDLKPDNVMVTRDGVAKILDFGLARLAWPDLDSASSLETTLAHVTASGGLLGTPGYISPEQALGKPADFRSDQFAFGALVYEMATCDRPFGGGTIAESLAATIRDEPEPLRTKRAEVPVPLAWVVERCLSKDPDERYDSTKDLARDFADIRDHLSDLGGLPPELGPGSRPPRARRVMRTLAAIGAVALIGAGVLAGRRMMPTVSPPTYRPLTFRPGIITGARFSPDGKTVYYSAAFGTQPSRVYTTRLDGAESELLKLPPAMLLSVSHKDDLAVLLTKGLNLATSVGTLAQVPPIGGTPRLLLENTVDADWTPDGDRLAVLRSSWVIEFPPGHPTATAALMPRISPRGDRIAWIAHDGVVIADLGGHVLVKDPMWAFGLAWARDGHEVWFTGSEVAGSSNRSLYALALDGSRRLIARAPGGLTVLDVSPDGKDALIAIGAGSFSIAASRRGDAYPRSLDLYGRTNVRGLSSDGRWVLANETAEVGHGAYLCSTDGEQTIRLNDDEALGLSPDGRWALTRPIASAHLMLVPTSAGSSRDISGPPDLEPVDAPARWSGDGRRLFVAFARKGQGVGSVRLFMREADRPWRPVTPEGLVHEGFEVEFAVSPDGGLIAARDASGLVTLFPVDGGVPRPLNGERGLPFSWTSDGRWLFLRRQENLTARIYRRDLSTGRIDPWWDVAPPDPSGATGGVRPWLADDGSFVVYQFYRVSTKLYLAQGLR